MRMIIVSLLTLSAMIVGIPGVLLLRACRVLADAARKLS